MSKRLDLKTNPVRVARIRHRYSIEEAASLVGISTHAWYLAELGAYGTPSKKVLNFFKQLGHDPKTFKKDYRDWISQRRLALSPTLSLASFPPVVLERVSLEIETEPVFEYLKRVLNTSVTNVCKLLCIHPSNVYKLKNKKVDKLPKQVKQALLEAGLPVGYVEELQCLYDEYYPNSNSNSNSKGRGL